MSTYTIERDPTKTENAFAVKVEGKAIGWFATPADAQLFINKCKEAQHVDDGPRPPEAPQEPEVVTVEQKLIKSIKVLRKELMGEVRPGQEELAEAVMDVAATFILSFHQQSEALRKISNAIVAQTQILAAVHSDEAYDGETGERVKVAMSDNELA